MTLPAMSLDTRLVRETKPLSPEAESRLLQVTQGFDIQLFASEPMINKPINLAFDERGKLWVSSTVEYPFAAHKERWADPQGSQVQGSRDAIKVLEDTDGDGRADKVTDFADGLNIATGVVPWHKSEHKAGCIAWSIPNIWYFADSDGDGRADLREVLFGPLGYEKDTHGMCSSFRLGPDGWVYATHGFNNTSHFTAKDGSTLDLHSGNVFRFKPDGSRIELYSAGQVNPFGLCWNQRGHLYSADCHSNPVTQLIRGAFYPSFGKPHDGLGFGPVMCEHSHGSTGLCGIVYIDGGRWGPEWDHHLFIGNCVTSKVNHDLVTFTGTTPKANERPDFITSEDPWFRPVDLTMGPDNALYVADFYNRVIGHYEVPLDHPGRDRERGRIWRISKKDASKSYKPSSSPDRTPHLVDLESTDPFTVRETAAWLAEHPTPLDVARLMAALKSAEKADVSLIHQLRISLRNALTLPGTIASISDTERSTILDVIKAVPSAEASAALLPHASEDASLLSTIVRNGNPETVSQAIRLARHTADQVGVIQAMSDAFLERGTAPPQEFYAWATELAEGKLKTAEERSPSWTNRGGESPWCIQPRQATDGRAITVISSLNKDLKDPEKRTGTLVSQSFAAPDTLTFWICGHHGFPKAEANRLNKVQLINRDGAVVREAFPPRNDTAQKISWDLSDLGHAQMRLQLVDEDNGSAYAWLGVGRIEPPVVKVEDLDSSDHRQKELRQLATILRTVAPVGLRDKLTAYLPQAPQWIKPEPVPGVDMLIQKRIKGLGRAKTDSTKGASVFKTHCVACHRIKGEGGLVGPQLDGIGNRGAARLMEDIFDPNRNVDTHFQVHQIKRRDDSIATGFVRGEVGQTIVLVDAAGNEQRIAKGDVAEDKTLPASVMPPAFGQVIPEQEFYHLIAWLLKS